VKAQQRHVQDMALAPLIGTDTGGLALGGRF
jgi:hypothetical protein